jgi:predicted porin
MKKNMIALAVAAAFAAPVAMADAPTIYGQLNVNFGSENTDAATAVSQDVGYGSTASRFGIKGSEDLGNGLKAVYKLEWGVDAGAVSSLSNRNSYLGLAGGFGTVLAGRHDTPTKMSQASDLFGDGAADLVNDNMIGDISGGDDRLANVLAYVSPSFSGVKLIAATQMSRTENDAQGSSYALTYGSTKKGLYGAVAMTDYDNSTDNSTRISAQYKAGALIANAIMHNADNGSYTQVQAAYKFGKFMPKIKVTMADSDAQGTSTNTAVGLNYSLGKKTTAYVYTVNSEVRDGSASYVGMVHKF